MKKTPVYQVSYRFFNHSVRFISSALAKSDSKELEVMKEYIQVLETDNRQLQYTNEKLTKRERILQDELTQTAFKLETLRYRQQGGTITPDTLAMEESEQFEKIRHSLVDSSPTIEKLVHTYTTKLVDLTSQVDMLKSNRNNTPTFTESTDYKRLSMEAFKNSASKVQDVIQAAAEEIRKDMGFLKEQVKVRQCKPLITFIDSIS